MAEILGRLATDLGERSTYDAASQCSRCGYCEQSCPTYKATGDEKKSPRGRNQLVRLLLEKKLPDPSVAAEALDTCLLCSACTTTCYAHVPTADIVLEGRRLLAAERPWLARRLSKLLLDDRPVFEALLKAANLAKRLGLSKLARPLLRAFGLPGLALADEHVELAPLRFSDEELSAECARAHSADKSADKSSAAPAHAPGDCDRSHSGPLQFLPCGTRYLFTGVAKATHEALDTTPLDTPCCGLLAYNYGELADAREFARRVIAAAEGDISAPERKSRDVVVDCSSCAAFLKSYPQLFLDEPEWKARAQAFAARVKDAAELLAPPQDASVMTYHESCRACHGQGLKAPDGFRPLKDSKECCGGAGAYSFLHPELSDELLRKKVHNIALTRAKVVATSSTSCLIQLAHGLRKYYPACVVKHVSEIAAFPDGETRS